MISTQRKSFTRALPHLTIPDSLYHDSFPKHIKTSKPSGLLPGFDTAPKTAALWKRTQVLRQGAANPEPRALSSPAETDSYGGYADEEECGEATAQVTLSKTTQVCASHVRAIDGTITNSPLQRSLAM
jgi:hypothetical protein